MIKIKYESLKDFNDLFGFSGLNEMPKDCIKGATLLSVEEAEKLSEEDRICKYKGEPYFWWLRSAGYYDYSACIVNIDGDVRYDYYCSVYFTDIGIRPALILNLQSSNLKKGDHFGFGGYDFKIISEDLAVCEEIIGKCAFREDYKAEDANVYEKSDVKKYVDNWFEKAYAEYEG